MAKDIGELARRYTRVRKAFKKGLSELKEAEEKYNVLKRQGFPDGRETAEAVTGLPEAQASEKRVGKKVVRVERAIREHLPINWSDLEAKARVMGTFVQLGEDDAVALIRDIIEIATDPRT